MQFSRTCAAFSGFRSRHVAFRPGLHPACGFRSFDVLSERRSIGLQLRDTYCVCHGQFRGSVWLGVRAIHPRMCNTVTAHVTVYCACCNSWICLRAELRAPSGLTLGSQPRANLLLLCGVELYHAAWPPSAGVTSLYPLIHEGTPAMARSMPVSEEPRQRSCIVAHVTLWQGIRKVSRSEMWGCPRVSAAPVPLMTVLLLDANMMHPYSCDTEGSVFRLPAASWPTLHRSVAPY